MQPHKIVSRDEWLAARKVHLAKEKAFTKARDQLSAERRQLPWERVEKPYAFDTPNGKETLSDLFDGRSQLIVYHFMLGPGWEEGCSSCSFLADHFDGAAVHLAQRDVTLLVVSRAPLAEIEAYKQRMAGVSNGFRPMATTSTPTTTCHSARTMRRAARWTTNTRRRTSSATRCPGPACSIRTRPAPSSTLIRPMRAASTFWSARITSSTSRRRAAMRTHCPGPRPGYGAMTNIRTRSGLALVAVRTTR